MKFPQNSPPSRARDPVQSDARSIRESASPVAIRPEQLCKRLPDIDRHDAMRRLLRLRAAHSPAISSLRSVHSRGSANARQTNWDRTASESPSPQTRKPYNQRQSSTLSDEYQRPRKKETTTLRAGSSCPSRPA